MQQVTRFVLGDLGSVLPGQALRIVSIQICPECALDTRGITINAAAVYGYDDVISLRRRDDTFFGIRSEPGVPDTVVVVRVCTCVQQLRQ